MTSNCEIEWGTLLQARRTVVCGAHGDAQILQTAFQKVHGSQHRFEEPVETAALRPILLASSAPTFQFRFIHAFGNTMPCGGLLP
jgi:hypothetical protein